MKRAQKRSKCGDSNSNNIASRDQSCSIPVDAVCFSPYFYFNNDYYQDDEISSTSTPTTSPSSKSFNSVSSYDCNDYEFNEYEMKMKSEDSISEPNHYEEILNYLAYELNWKS